MTKKCIIICLLIWSIVSCAADENLNTIKFSKGNNFDPGVVYLKCVNGKPTYFCQLAKDADYIECSREEAYKLAEMYTRYNSDEKLYFSSPTEEDFTNAEKLVCKGATNP